MIHVHLLFKSTRKQIPEKCVYVDSCHHRKEVTEGQAEESAVMKDGLSLTALVVILH